LKLDLDSREEVSTAARLWTRGWDLFLPTRSGHHLSINPSFMLYAHGVPVLLLLLLLLLLLFLHLLHLSQDTTAKKHT